MKTNLKFILLIIAFSYYFAQVEILSIEDTILEPFVKKSTKELFKVWHLVHKKTYDYNTEEGIAKYKTFKANLAKIEKHNEKNLSWKEGLTPYTDMTFEEFKTYFNIKNFNLDKVRNKIREFNHVQRFSLDNYDDNESNTESLNFSYASNLQDGPKYSFPQNIDWTSLMQPVRNQGSCGSCWAFATAAMIVGVWKRCNSGFSDFLSTQQLVDCDTSNAACNGGWFEGAINYWKSTKPLRDADYSYVAYKKACTIDTTKALDIRIDGFKTSNESTSLYALLLKGPVAVAVWLNSDFQNYKSGVFFGCDTNNTTSNVNHAVTVVGEKYLTFFTSYWIVNNSWGTGWGIQGYMWLPVRYAPLDCNLSMYGYQATFSN